MADELPAAPIPTDNALSGGVWVSGAGFDQTSGTPLGYAEYRQWLTIEYTRNPNDAMPASNTEARSLSQLSATDVKNVFGTILHFNITAHNSCTFLSGTYDLSASYQPQKFTVMAQKFDKAGYSYGDVSGAANAFVFGPAGTILTHQPYVRRRNIQYTGASADVEYSYTQVGTCNGLSISGPVDGWGAGGRVWGWSQISHPYAYYVPQHWDIVGAAAYPLSLRMTWAADIYGMVGGEYATTSEVAYGNNTAGLQRLILFLETNCACLNASDFNDRFCNTQPKNSDGFHPIVEADRLVINPYYSTAFHDYS